MKPGTTRQPAASIVSNSSPSASAPRGSTSPMRPILSPSSRTDFFPRRSGASTSPFPISVSMSGSCQCVPVPHPGPSHQGGGDGEQAEAHMGQPDTVLETEQPGGSREQHPPGQVEQEVGAHGEHARHTQLVVGQQAVDDRTQRQNHRNPGFRSPLAPPEKPGGAPKHHAPQPGPKPAPPGPR